VATILVPYHQDDRLPDEMICPPAGLDVEVVVPLLPQGDQWQRLAFLYQSVADAVRRHVAPGSPPTVISGDCLVALGSLAGVQRAGVDASLVWFDAHGDLHTVQSSTSGYLGGMALRMALGGDPEKVTAAVDLEPLREDHAVLVDARDLDPAESDFLGSGHMRRLDLENVHGDLFADRPMVVHLDADVIDPNDLTGLLFPAPGGPSQIAVIDALRRLFDTGRVVAFDIACPWHPAENQREIDARAGLLADLLALVN
jgi:arginase